MKSSSPNSSALLHQSLLLASVAFALAGCGGGGGGGGAEEAASAAPGDTVASAPATPAPSTLAATLGDGAGWVLTGEPTSRKSADRAVASAVAGRTFYVDANTGNDASSGMAGTTSGDNGPWRTLARLKQAALAPGDRVVLACDSVWRETLTLAARGSTSLPIVVGAPDAGCTKLPAIEGGTTIAPSAWTQYSGNIYRAPLGAQPLQLTMTDGVFTEAHHPNVGYSTSAPSSPYLALAADGNVVSVGSGRGSTWVNTGPDLMLPAGAELSAGMRVRVRPNSWTLDERVIASASGGRIVLSSPTSYPLQAGWGYFLLGARWMLDSAGEWYYDPAARQIYAWMPDSLAPTRPVAASTLAAGVVLDGSSDLVLTGVSIAHVGIGISMEGTTRTKIFDSVIQDTASTGIAMVGSTAAVIDGNNLQRIGTEAISGVRGTLAQAQGAVIRDNVVVQSGVLVDGDRILSLPVGVLAAINAGKQATVSSNWLRDSAYNGILVAPDNAKVHGNMVYGACTVLDDGGGIYTYGSRGTEISSNTVTHSRGNKDGKPADWQFTQGHGIYLDKNTDGAVIEANTVMDADYGLMVFSAFNNHLVGNTLYGNRKSQIWLQASTNSSNPSGDVFGNEVAGNKIAPVRPSAYGVGLQNAYTGTGSFGTFDLNGYYDRDSKDVTRNATPSNTTVYTLDQWKATNGVGTQGAVEPNGTILYSKSFATYAIAGTNIVPNAGLVTDAYGWQAYNATAPSGTLARVGCAVGNCLRYTPGGSAGIVSSPNFTVVKDQWYRLTVDLAADTASQQIQLVVRRGGGGSNGYESLADRSLYFTTGGQGQFGRYSVVFRATKTVNYRDPATGDWGARVDLQNLVSGKGVSFGNMELVAVTMDDTAAVSSALSNAGATTAYMACPYQSSQPSLCAKMMIMGTTTPASWPLEVPGYTTTLLYAADPKLFDADGDAIPDAQDACPGTPQGAGVNARGCAIGQ